TARHRNRPTNILAGKRVYYRLSSLTSQPDVSAHQCAIADKITITSARPHESKQRLSWQICPLTYRTITFRLAGNCSRQLSGSKVTSGQMAGADRGCGHTARDQGCGRRYFTYTRSIRAVLG